jgi:hypothetical protein
MSFYSFVSRQLSSFKAKPQVKKKSRNVSLSEMMTELGVRSDSIIGTYNEEERSDSTSIDQYIQMQENDGTVRAITRLFAMPIQAAELRILAAPGDKGERDFIENNLMGPQFQGGMTTPLQFVIADMTRAFVEGFRLYEKIPYIIEEGPYKNMIGWKKLAPRDSNTLDLLSDVHGGFNGARQTAMRGAEQVNVVIPPEKSILFTFQRERHPLYGESILKTAFYHYDKKHKLYYLAHKKAEIDAVGLKVLRLTKPMSDKEVGDAEEVIDSIGVNSRVTLPSGFDLDIDRSPTGYDVLKLIEHHDTQIALSTLTQAMRMGTGSTYAYTYGSGYKTQGGFILQMLDSVMRNIENTLNQWAIAPLIDWNFGTKAYPQLKLVPSQSGTQDHILKIFEELMKKDPERMITPGFAEKLADEAADILGLEITDKTDKIALRSFETGKKRIFDKKGLPAKATPKEIKRDLQKKAIKLKDDPYFLEKFETMGRKFAEQQIVNL